MNRPIDESMIVLMSTNTIPRCLKSSTKFVFMFIVSQFVPPDLSSIGILSLDSRICHF